MNILDRRGVETVVLSIGGSLVVPKTGIDVDFLKKLNVFIRKQVRESNRRFFIVIGGGATARQYRDAARDVVGEISDADLDWIGIHSTRLNAHLVRTIFQDIAHARIIDNYDKPLIGARESVIIGAGWKPGWSTDYCAAVLARDYKASLIINLSNIDYVYDKDPNLFPDAKIIKHTTWEFFEGLIPEKWIPGTNAPFDPVASRLAKKYGTAVIVANGKNFSNLTRILNGESFKGTVITNYKIDETFYDKDYFESQRKERWAALSESFISRFIVDLAHFYRALSIKLFINPKTCLDLGCGDGGLVHHLRRFGIQAFGIDISEYAISSANKEIQPFLSRGDIKKLPFEDGAFDLVVSFDVLEHIQRAEIKNVAMESARVAKKFVLHKIYTTENLWIEFTQPKDFSHISVQSQAFWLNIFRSLDNVSIVKKFVFKLPSFFESVFLLRKKTV
ncbi:UMP kinase [Candidatus Woesebacteria bacterium]|nr:UMP kinase [Candidatus Woesebacteria bacterium]